ncbi:hypothetical protein [Spiroplasma endosymbiont of Virgichneumon dumeticola]
MNSFNFIVSSTSTCGEKSVIFIKSSSIFFEPISKFKIFNSTR